MDWVWKGKSAAMDALFSPTIDLFCYFNDHRGWINPLLGNNSKYEYLVSYDNINNQSSIFQEGLKKHSDFSMMELIPKNYMFHERIQKETGFFYANFDELFFGPPTILTKQKRPDGQFEESMVGIEGLQPTQSILAQRREPTIYPELTTLANNFRRIRIYRDWQFGRSAIVRRSQQTDLEIGELLPNLENLGLVLNELQMNSNLFAKINDACRRFLPRFERWSIRIQNGRVQINLHEEGLSTPIPASRLSDGTMRFLSLVVILLTADQSPLTCIEEPELGLHPDALPIIAELMTEASKTSQLIVTTHSDALVSEFSATPEVVMVSEYRQGVGTMFHRLEAESLGEWLEKYSLGELWTMGKIGGNP